MTTTTRVHQQYDTLQHIREVQRHLDHETLYLSTAAARATATGPYQVIDGYLGQIAEVAEAQTFLDAARRLTLESLLETP